MLAALLCISTTIMVYSAYVTHTRLKQLERPVQDQDQDHEPSTNPSIDEARLIVVMAKVRQRVRWGTTDDEAKALVYLHDKYEALEKANIALRVELGHKPKPASDNYRG